MSTEQILQFLYPDAKEWEYLSFGLLGGLDIGQQSHLLRKHPLKLQIHTFRHNFQDLCHLLNIPYQELPIAADWKSEDIQNILKKVQNVFWVQGNQVWRLQGHFTGWCGQALDGRIQNSSQFHFDDSQRLILLGDFHQMPMKSVLKLVLAEQCAYYSNSTGVEMAVNNWLNLIRRPSLRKSWPSLLSVPRHYFWMAVHLYSQIHLENDVAYRERYVQFLRVASEYLEVPKLQEIALLFRKSISIWQVLGSVLLDSSSKALSQISKPHPKALDSKKTTNTDHTETIMEMESIYELWVHDQLALFLTESIDLDIESRLFVIEDCLKKILQAEQEAFQQIAIVLQHQIKDRKKFVTA